MMRKLGWWFSIVISSASATAYCQVALQQNDSTDYFFERGRYEVRADTGVMFSPVGAVVGRPTLNYTLSGVQLGWMLTDVNSLSWLRGNVEVAGEAIGGTPFEGRGTYLVGGTGWVRYNFVQPRWQVVPYVQAGAGAELTDFDARLLGERFNFNLNIGVGARWFVAQNWSVDLECRYQHLSNAKLSPHDIGVNAVGPMLGISYFF